MEHNRYKVLLINDDPENVRLLHTLKKTGVPFDFVHIAGYDAGLARLGSEKFDILLLDIEHANGRGEEILTKVLKHVGNTPTLVLTGIHNQSLGNRALQLGARDYLVKERLDADSLHRALRYAVERRKTEKALMESEARYRHLLESVTDYVYTVQIENGRPVASWHSPSCVAVTGYTSEEYTADPFLWYQMIHEQDREAVMEQAAAVLSGKPAHSLEHQIMHKDGSIRWIKNTPVPRYDQLGRLVAYDGLVADITERKRAELELIRVNKALRESEEKLKQELNNLSRAKNEWEVTFDAISNPLFIHDKDYRIVRANRAYSEAAGKAFLEMIGKPYYTIFPKMEAPFRNCELAMTAADGKPPLSSEEISVPSLGKVFGAKSYPVHDAGGNYLYSVHILEDITEMKRAEENIKQEIEITANLLMIAETTAFTMDLDKLMEHVVRGGSRAMGCDAALSYLWERERKVFQPAQHHGLDHELVPLFKTESLDAGLEFVQLAMETKKPVIVRCSATGTRLSFVAVPFTEGTQGPVTTKTLSWMSNDMRTLVAVPLIGKTDYLGVIITMYRGIRTFTERDAKIVAGFSREVSLALDEAHLYRTAMERSLELDHKMETLQVIHEIDRSILSLLEPREILETTIRNIPRIVPCDKAGIMLADRERQGFTYATGVGFLSAPAHTSFLPFDDTSAAEVIKTARPQYVGNIEGQGNILPKERTLMEEGFVSHIRVPLVVKGKPVGVLSVDSKRPAAFTPENLSILEKLATLIGVALENTRLLTDLKELFIGTVTSLSNAIDAKSPWTAGHSARVTRYALLIGRRLGFCEGELKDLELAGLLHDIGKIGTYDVILDKPGTLTREEYDIVKNHARRGAELLQPIKQLGCVIPCIKHHHERYDGMGYPDGLKGENIPLWARILAIADAFDAMVEERPYRKTFETKKAIAELKRCSGTQFDPVLVEVFVDLVKTSGEQWDMKAQGLDARDAAPTLSDVLQ
jgi:PAS domain S-box-containing protein/putative nucleotidyltransferase with HDIG domain